MVAGETETVPDMALAVENPVPVHEVAFVEDQVSAELLPVTIEVGLAERVAVGAGAAAETVIAVHGPQSFCTLVSFTV